MLPVGQVHGGDIASLLGDDDIDQGDPVDGRKKSPPGGLSSRPRGSPPTAPRSLRQLTLQAYLSPDYIPTLANSASMAAPASSSRPTAAAPSSTITNPPVAPSDATNEVLPPLTRRRLNLSTPPKPHRKSGTLADSKKHPSGPGLESAPAATQPPGFSFCHPFDNCISYGAKGPRGNFPAEAIAGSSHDADGASGRVPIATTGAAHTITGPVEDRVGGSSRSVIQTSGREWSEFALGVARPGGDEEPVEEQQGESADPSSWEEEVVYGKMRRQRGPTLAEAREEPQPPPGVAEGAAGILRRELDKAPRSQHVAGKGGKPDVAAAAAAAAAAVNAQRRAVVGEAGEGGGAVATAVGGASRPVRAAAAKAKQRIKLGVDILMRGSRCHTSGLPVPENPDAATGGIALNADIDTDTDMDMDFDLGVGVDGSRQGSGWSGGEHSGTQSRVQDRNPDNCHNQHPKRTAVAADAAEGPAAAGRDAGRCQRPAKDAFPGRDISVILDAGESALDGPTDGSDGVRGRGDSGGRSAAAAHSGCSDPAVSVAAAATAVSSGLTASTNGGEIDQEHPSLPGWDPRRPGYMDLSVAVAYRRACRQGEAEAPTDLPRCWGIGLLDDKPVLCNVVLHGFAALVFQSAIKAALQGRLGRLQDQKVVRVLEHNKLVPKEVRAVEQQLEEKLRKAAAERMAAAAAAAAAAGGRGGGAAGKGGSAALRDWRTLTKAEVLEHLPEFLSPSRKVEKVVLGEDPEDRHPWEDVAAMAGQASVRVRPGCSLQAGEFIGVYSAEGWLQPDWQAKILANPLEDWDEPEHPCPHNFSAARKHHFGRYAADCSLPETLLKQLHQLELPDERLRMLLEEEPDDCGKVYMTAARLGCLVAAVNDPRRNLRALCESEADFRAGGPNVAVVTAVILGILPVLIMVATTDIQETQHVMYSYGHSYWELHEEEQAVCRDIEAARVQAQGEVRQVARWKAAKCRHRRHKLKAQLKALRLAHEQLAEAAAEARVEADRSRAEADTARLEAGIAWTEMEAARQREESQRVEAEEARQRAEEERQGRMAAEEELQSLRASLPPHRPTGHHPQDTAEAQQPSAQRGCGPPAPAPGRRQQQQQQQPSCAPLMSYGAGDAAAEVRGAATTDLSLNIGEADENPMSPSPTDIGVENGPFDVQRSPLGKRTRPAAAAAADLNAGSPTVRQCTGTVMATALQMQRRLADVARPPAAAAAPIETRTSWSSHIVAAAAAAAEEPHDRRFCYVGSNDLEGGGSMTQLNDGDCIGGSGVGDGVGVGDGGGGGGGGENRLPGDAAPGPKACAGPSSRKFSRLSLRSKDHRGRNREGTSEVVAGAARGGRGEAATALSQGAARPAQWLPGSAGHGSGALGQAAIPGPVGDVRGVVVAAVATPGGPAGLVSAAAALVLPDSHEPQQQRQPQEQSGEDPALHRHKQQDLKQHSGTGWRCAAAVHPQGLSDQLQRQPARQRQQQPSQQHEPPPPQQQQSKLAGDGTGHCVGPTSGLRLRAALNAAGQPAKAAHPVEVVDLTIDDDFN